MELRLRAQLASEGVAIGTIHKLELAEPVAAASRIDRTQIEREKKRYRDAVAKCSWHLTQLISQADDTEQAAILRAHLSILQDPYLEQLTMERIDGLENSERALMLAVDEVVQRFLALEDEMMRERVADVRDEAVRLLACMRGETPDQAPTLQSPAIVIARDLPPSFAAQMDRTKVLGIATEQGGRTSHTAIMARNMDIPALVGAAGLFAAAEDGMTAIVDAVDGEVILEPTEETLHTARQKLRQVEARQRRLATLLALPSQTTDGHALSLQANIGFEKECGPALERGAEGVGLLRTEYLYMESRRFPSEERQLATYRYIAKQMAPHPVVIRTLDIGGDKALSYYPFAHETNPVLGLRAIRFCLQHTDIFKTQLRAILRASAHGAVRLMYPMIATLDELLQANKLLALCKAELRGEGLPFNEDIPVGIMIETPSAVVMADQLAKHAAFFSIGTNDLTQYVLAADRTNDSVNRLFSDYDPAVLRSIRLVAKAAQAERRPVSVCGELAADLRAVPLLLGLGLDALSVSPAAIPPMKQVVRALSYSDAKALADEVDTMRSAAEIEARLEAFVTPYLG